MWNKQNLCLFDVFSLNNITRILLFGFWGGGGGGGGGAGRNEVHNFQVYVKYCKWV